MTELPGPGNIRSDGGAGRRGFGGLWDLLNTIASGIGALPTIASDIAAIRVLLTRLMGASDSPSWPGLTPYLHQHFARSDTPAFLNLPRLYEDVRNVTSNVSLIPGFLTSGTPTGTNTPYLASILARATAIDGNTDGLETRLDTIAGALQDPNFLPSVPYLRQLLDAIGRYSDDPAALTVKQLLKAQVDCCEGGGTPGGGLNPAPSALCISDDGWSAPVRCTRFEEIPNGSGSGVYGVVFDAGLTAIGLQNQADISPTWNFPGLKSLSGDAVEVCFSWDLEPFAGTGLAYNRYNTVAANWGSGDQLAAGSVSLQPSPQAAQATIPAGQAVGLQIILDAPGTLPGLNFFVKARGVAS